MKKTVKPRPKMFTESQYNRLKKDRDGWREMYADQSIKTLQIPILEKNLSLKESMLDEVCKQRDEFEKAKDYYKDMSNRFDAINERLIEQYNTLLSAFQNTAKLLEQR